MGCDLKLKVLTPMLVCSIVAKGSGVFLSPSGIKGMLSSWGLSGCLSWPSRFLSNLSGFSSRSLGGPLNLSGYIVDRLCVAYVKAKIYSPEIFLLLDHELGEYWTLVVSSSQLDQGAGLKTICERLVGMMKPAWGHLIACGDLNILTECRNHVCWALDLVGSSQKFVRQDLLEILVRLY